MKANSGLKKNRTKIQMVLSALVILSVVPQFLDRKLNVTIPPGLETVILIFIFSA